MRKTSRATAVVYGNGTGKVTVNGIDVLRYFPVLQDRWEHDEIVYFSCTENIPPEVMLCNYVSVLYSRVGAFFFFMYYCLFYED